MSLRNDPGLLVSMAFVAFATAVLPPAIGKLSPAQSLILAIPITFGFAAVMLEIEQVATYLIIKLKPSVS